eukprot:TRINITY_DN5210_c0_g1_i3.p1 TRINITY_DN5210_c0_g1~~TRINITY_DN5210_c0_g1_i3.p1  ORF type:complete len:367 (-),score=64.88 TRINITY_DN5210_c0_g1_i3:656-1756(-)
MSNKKTINTIFTWAHSSESDSVQLAGSFNDWKPVPMVWESNVWQLSIDIRPGVHFYKFVVNGEWCFDITNPTISDAYNYTNNVLCLDFSMKIPFWWEMGGRKVSLIGSWNDWKGQQPLKQTNYLGKSKFYTEVDLPLGTWYYKYIIDGDYKFDDRLPYRQHGGHLNNYCEVNMGQQLHYYFQSSDNFGLSYLLYTPPEYGVGQDLPLILYLHSEAEKGDINKLRVGTGIPAQIAKGRNLPFIVLSPLCVSSRWTDNRVTKSVLELLFTTLERYNINTSQVYLTGHSMGGYGAWNILNEIPEVFAAAAIFSGGGNQTDAARLAEVPIRAYASCGDSVVPFSETEGKFATFDLCVLYLPNPIHNPFHE